MYVYNIKPLLFSDFDFYHLDNDFDLASDRTWCHALSRERSLFQGTWFHNLYMELFIAIGCLLAGFILRILSAGAFITYYCGVGFLLNMSIVFLFVNH